MIYYLPSCQFTAAHTQDSTLMKAYLGQKEDVTVAKCCKVSQDLFQDGDTVLTICQSCHHITEEVSPQANTISLWEYLLTDDAFPWPDYHGEEITVQDCLRARENRPLQEAVRECLKRMNMVPVELEENYEKTMFDGLWRYRNLPEKAFSFAPRFFTEMQENYITPLPEEEAVALMKEHAALYRTKRVVTYCNACLKGVLAGGADGVHLGSLLTGRLSAVS